MAPRQSLSDAIAAERARRVPDAVAVERARCLAILAREIDAAIAEPQTGVSALVRAIRRAERAIQDGEKGNGSESEVHRAR
jgi:hypothetical protein